jgi:hypothetical protein
MLCDVCPETPSSALYEYQWSIHAGLVLTRILEVEHDILRTYRLHAFRELDMDPFCRQEVFRVPSWGVVQILVRYRVSFYMAFFRICSFDILIG